MPNNDSIIPIAVEDEIKESYLTYAMSVIVSRALPDVRDGLKPVHRRILYSMNDLGLHHNRPFRKSVRVVGDVLARFHPHGDAAVYEALVRLAQTFSLRMPVIDSQGNFGSIDGDPPAAMRYTEARLANIAETMLRDIKKETVDFRPNFDDSVEEPSVLPALLPFLLINGTSGIAVGMATNMAPHNPDEVFQAAIALIDNPELTDLDIYNNYIKGPDFPTYGIICGTKGIRDAYLTGKGKVVLRARIEIEEFRNNREAIIVTELPYQVNKSNLMIKIAQCIKDERIVGISDLRDESDRNGIRIVIELKATASPLVVQNQLFTHTALQTSFHINNLALENGQPKLFTIKGLLSSYIAHRKEVIERRIVFDLKKAREREHILQGLKIALDNIDEVIETIKKSQNSEIAKNKLIEKFGLSSIQAQAILDMRLHRLTSLETQRILDELKELLALITELEDILAHDEKLYAVIKEEIEELKIKYSDKRRTEITYQELDGNINNDDLIEEEDMILIISHQGFIKRMSTSVYSEQGRGGKGSKSSTLRDEDFVKHVYMANSHTNMLFITNKGKAYYKKVYELPQGSRTSKGSHIRSILNFEENEEITACVPIKEFSENQFIFMATKKASVKRVSTYEFRNAKTKGIRAISLDEDDALISAILTEGSEDVILLTRNGKGLRFNQDKVRTMGRTASGVRGIKLQNNDILIGVSIPKEEEDLLIITENGYGKRMTPEQFTPHGRGTMGQIAYKLQEKTGKIVSLISVELSDGVVAITNQGKAIKISAENISSQGRNASGVRLLNVDEKSTVVGATRLNKEEEQEEE